MDDFNPDDYDIDDGPRELHTMTFEERQAAKASYQPPPPITFGVPYTDAIRLTWWVTDYRDSEDVETWTEGWHLNEFGVEHAESLSDVK